MRNETVGFEYSYGCCFGGKQNADAGGEVDPGEVEPHRPRHCATAHTTTMTMITTMMVMMMMLISSSITSTSSITNRKCRHSIMENVLLIIIIMMKNDDDEEDDGTMGWMGEIPLPDRRRSGIMIPAATTNKQ